MDKEIVRSGVQISAGPFLLISKKYLYKKHKSFRHSDIGGIKLMNNLIQNIDDKGRLEICLNQWIGRCFNCTYDMDTNHHPNNKDCSFGYSPIKLFTFSVKDSLESAMSGQKPVTLEQLSDFELTDSGKIIEGLKLFDNHEKKYLVKEMKNDEQTEYVIVGEYDQK